MRTTWKKRAVAGAMAAMMLVGIMPISAMDATDVASKAGIAQVLPEIYPEILPEIVPEILPEILPEIWPEILPEILPEIWPEILPELFPEELLAEQSVTVGYPEYSNEIPTDFENDLWLQYDFQELEVGATARIFPRRVPQIIKDWAHNIVTRPNFNFEIAEGDSVKLSTNEGNDATVTAVKEGTSVVKVTYDAVTANEIEYGASSVVNTAYVVFAVGETGTVEPVMDDYVYNLSYDTMYYTKEEDSYPLTFTAGVDDAESAELAELEVTCNGKVIGVNSDGTYTTNLGNRSNIIGVVATDNDGNTQSVYKVVDARVIEIIKTNKTYPTHAFAVGDTMNVSFKGITMPIYKLGSIYNPCPTKDWGRPDWNTTAARVVYSDDNLSEFKGFSDAYDLATNNDFDVTFTTAGDFAFKGEGIFGDVYANDIGDDKTSEQTGGASLGSDYPIHHYKYSKLPDFTVSVKETTTATPLESIAFGKSEITMYKGDRLNEAAMIEELGGVTIAPVDATNKTYHWSTSAKYTLSIYDGFYAQSTGTATLTATTVDGKKTAQCTVTIIDGPATDAEKNELNEKITEAKAVTKVDGTESAWATFQAAIATAQATLSQDGLLGMQAETATKDLTRAIIAYAAAVDDFNIFGYTITQEKVEEGTQVTVNFPNLPLNQFSSSPTSLKLVYATDIDGMESVFMDGTDNAENLRELTFLVDESISGSVTLSGGYVEEMSYVYRPPRPQLETRKHFEGKLPDIVFTLGEDDAITPPKPEAKEVKISIDKLEIGEGYVLEKTAVDLSENDTVWDVTRRIMDENGIAYEYTGAGNNVYISSIDGDGEFDHGSRSGWMYSVNGTYPDVGCNAYDLDDGDVVKWRYTTELGDDIGGGNPDKEEGVIDETEGLVDDKNEIFSDILSNIWYEESVVYLYENGLMAGTSETEFSPHESANRAMVVGVLYNLVGSPEMSGTSSFGDVTADAWYADAVQWAKEDGIANGNSEDTFAPNDSITREAISIILMNYAKTQGVKVVASNAMESFNDFTEVSSWAMQSMNWAVEFGIMSGKSDNNLDPKGTASRAEVAVMIHTMIEKLQ